MARGPSLKIPSVAGTVKGADAVDFVRRVGAEPRYVDVTFAATNIETVRHGLGRRMRGAKVVGITQPHDSMISAYLNDPNGADPAVWLTVGTNTAYTGTVTLEVF